MLHIRLKQHNHTSDSLYLLLSMWEPLLLLYQQGCALSLQLSVLKVLHRSIRKGLPYSRLLHRLPSSLLCSQLLPYVHRDLRELLLLTRVSKPCVYLSQRLYRLCSLHPLPHKLQESVRRHRCIHVLSLRLSVLKVLHRSIRKGLPCSRLLRRLLSASLCSQLLPYVHLLPCPLLL